MSPERVPAETGSDRDYRIRRAGEIARELVAAMDELARSARTAREELDRLDRTLAIVESAGPLDVLDAGEEREDPNALDKRPEDVPEWRDPEA